MVLFDRFQTFEYFFLSSKRDEKESARIFPTPFLEKKKSYASQIALQQLGHKTCPWDRSVGSTAQKR